MNEAIDPTHSSTLEEPVEITEVITSDYLVERVIAAHTLRAVAQDLLHTGHRRPVPVLIMITPAAGGGR